MSELSRSGQRVRDALTALGIETHVRELPASTRTAKDAAKAVGCRVEQIAKSLVFRAPASDAAVMVITGGANRVDEAKVAALVGEEVKQAHPDFVRERTGYAIGGVPPIGHVTELQILFDEDLLREPEIWAAAGTPRGLFGIAPDELVRATGAAVAGVKE